MSDGIGCICAARSEGECCCDVDWTPQELIDARAEIERLRAERDALKKDAERYRWFRDSGRETWPSYREGNTYRRARTCDEVNEAIDKAMEESK